MKHRFIQRLTVLGAISLGLLISGCGGDTPIETTAPETTAVTEDITLTGTALEGYAIVVPRVSSDAESAAMMTLYKSAPASSLRMGNDNFDTEDKEILIGATNRPASAAALAALSEMKTEDAFHYILSVAEGKWVILADDPLGYTYALERIQADYIREGTLYMPSELHDAVTVTMEEYYASAHYADVLAEEKRKEERQAQIDAAQAKQLEEKLIRLKGDNAAFRDAAFGKVISFANSPYGKPEIYPEKGAHPRVLLTEKKLTEILAQITAEENAAAYAHYRAQVDMPFGDGTLPPLTEDMKGNYNNATLGILLAKAFYYLESGSEVHGYEAVVGLKNYILTLEMDPKEITGLYFYGYAMHVAGCIYDWCYDLLSDTDKEQIVAGCINKLAKNLEIGVPPNKQGALVGHGCGGQLLRQWLTLAIACYDEYPDMYEYVAGRIFEEFVPGQNFFLESGAHHQGNAYGIGRFESVLYAQLLFQRMTDEGHLVFSDGVRDTMTTFLYYIRPDGQGLRLGDDFYDHNASYTMDWLWRPAMFVAAMYGDPVLKGFAAAQTENFTAGFSSHTYDSQVSGLLFLLLNDPTLEAEDPTTLPLLRYNGSPTGAVVAHSAWEDPQALMVYMKIGEAYSSNHEHRDAGSFQIFYKGILASDSGAYDLYGTNHDSTYHKQTIAHNSLLIYNPALAGKHGSFEYSGGQSLKEMYAANTLTAYEKQSIAHQAQVIGYDYEASCEEYRFAYLAGDLSGAYDAETVDEVERHMLSVMTEEEARPMVFITYDRIVSDDASFKKTFLLHVGEEPTLRDSVAIVTNQKKNSTGKLVVQSAVTDTEYTVIGGEGQEFWVNGRNAETILGTEDCPYPIAPGIQEYGWGRIEISPAAAAETDRLLTVMYVSDEEETEPLQAKGIETDVVIGASILGKAAVFPKEDGRIREAFTFTAEGEGMLEYYIAGLTAGEWQITVNGKAFGMGEVSEESGLYRITAPSGTVTMTPAT